MVPERVDDAAGVERYVRSLLETRIGPVAYELGLDEPFTDAGVPSIDIVAIVAVIERDMGTEDQQQPAEFGDIADSCRGLRDYCLRIGASKGAQQVGEVAP
jgi:hypothetical protein